MAAPNNSRGGRAPRGGGTGAVLAVATKQQAMFGHAEFVVGNNKPCLIGINRTTVPIL